MCHEVWTSHLAVNWACNYSFQKEILTITSCIIAGFIHKLRAQSNTSSDRHPELCIDSERDNQGITTLTGDRGNKKRGLEKGRDK